MKRFFTVLAASTVALSLLHPSSAQAAFSLRPECRYRALGGSGWSVQNVRDTARCAAIRNRLPLTKFMSIVQCESGFRPFPGGSHYGPVQYLASTFFAHMSYFPRYVRWYRLPDHPANPRSNVLIAARYMSFYGYSPWSCA